MSRQCQKCFKQYDEEPSVLVEVEGQPNRVYSFDGEIPRMQGLVSLVCKNCANVAIGTQTTLTVKPQNSGSDGEPQNTGL